MLYHLLLACYIIVLSVYVIFESLSVAADTDTLVSSESNLTPSRCVYHRTISYIKFKLKSGKFCVSARYLISAVAGCFMLKESATSFFCIIAPKIVGTVLYCQAAVIIDERHALYITAIFLSCWSRMVYRLFGDRRTKERVHHA